MLAVCGSQEAAREAGSAGAQTLLETHPRGQNGAAQAAIDWVLGRGAEGLLLVSSDLPLVTPGVLLAVIAQGGALGERGAVAAAAAGRGGTNALFLRPPGVIGLHFGDRSLEKFERDARERGVPFSVHESDELALDLDEPSDLQALAGR